MIVKSRCEACGGSGRIERELRVGDIVTPQDGSAMCSALHSILFKGTGRGIQTCKSSCH